MPRHTLQETVRAIRDHKEFALAAHVNPEGDCVASLLALDSLLGKVGKKSHIFCEDPIPTGLSFLDNGRWKHSKTNLPAVSFDAAAVVDCGSMERIGKAQELLTAKKTFLINIDHHISNRDFGDINFVDVKAAASGELIYDLFRAFQVPLSKEDRELIYVSLSTDTGSFRYSNTTAKTHEIAGRLLAEGLDTETLNERLYDSMPLERFRLFKVFLDRIRFEDGGRIAYALVTDEDLKLAQAGKEHLEGFVEFMRSLRGVEISFLVTLDGENSRLSFRSKGSCDVNVIASNFGGGGHRKAAGCTIHAQPEEAVGKVLAYVRNSAH